MLKKLAGIEARFEELNRMLADPEVATDYTQVSEYAQERARIEPIVVLARKYRESTRTINEAETLLDDPEMRSMAEAEISALRPNIENMEQSIRRMLLPTDPRDERNVIVEIRAGAGGDEAALFAADIYRMYARYAENRRWSTDIISSN